MYNYVKDRVRYQRYVRDILHVHVRARMNVRLRDLHIRSNVFASRFLFFSFHQKSRIEVGGDHL